MTAEKIVNLLLLVAIAFVGYVYVKYMGAIT